MSYYKMSSKEIGKKKHTKKKSEQKNGLLICKINNIISEIIQSYQEKASDAIAPLPKIGKIGKEANVSQQE